MARLPVPPLLLAATLEVLRRHAPFDGMEAPVLERMAARLKLRYFGAGDVILAPGSGPVTTLFIVQRGVVEGTSPRGGFHATAVSLTEGECFPVGAILGHRPTSLEYRAAKDTFCYLLDEAGFHDAMASSRPFAHFCTQRLAQLLDQSYRQVGESFATRASAEMGMGSPLRSAVRRAPVTLPPTASVGQTLGLMRDKRIGSVVVQDDGGPPLGIFTQTDVIDRVALAGCSLDRPVREVMTPAPHGLQATASLAEAAHVMARHGIRHLLVMEGESLAGVLSERDLFALQRRSVQGLRKEINRAADREELAFVARDVLRLAGGLLAQGLAAETLTQLVTALNDAVVARALELASARHPAGATLCWIGLGSEGRMEQTLATDQDNAIIFVDPGRDEREALRERLLAFAAEANETLAECGFPLCKGDIMARNRRWCLTEAEWRERFDDWMRNANPEALLNAAIFFDFRALWGEAALAATLREFLLSQVSRTPAFLRQMATNALQLRPPIGFFNDISLDGKAGGKLDLKMHASRPFVEAARIFALATGVAATNTAERLRGSGPRLRMSDDEVGTAVQGFQFVQMLRLRRQEEGAEGADFAERNRVDPDSLNSLDRRILKEALRQARKLQNRLALDYQL